MESVSAAPANEVRPVVGRAVSNRGPWLFGGLLALAAIGLFAALEARRSEVISPATAPGREPAGSLIAPPPELAVPGGAGFDDRYGPYGLPRAVQLPPFGPTVQGPVPVTIRAVPQSVVPAPPAVRGPAFFDPDAPDPAYRPGLPQPVVAEDPPPVAGSMAGSRITATRFKSPSLTVPQGTVIQAVLETALDSNRPGFVRAIVSRDVRSFDGTRVLIPRGSRLFGEYKADLASGQNRAFVQWQKLTRPDGVQIALDSPAADPLGRAGIKGKVNSHFFQRFATALLQSTLDIGVGIATRSATNGTVVVGLPGSTQSIVATQPENIKPTLSVRQGSSVSVFVARDLDFSTVD